MPPAPSHFFDQIQNHFKNLKGKSFAFWGLSFKKNTDDIKNSPALALARKLLKAGAELHIYDPLIPEKKGSQLFPDQKVFFYRNPLDTLSSKEGLIIGSEAKEFQSLALEEIKEHLKNPFLVDGRNLFDAKELKHLGFHWYQAGSSLF